ncbi:MAG: arsenosugar biosynthesis radical SAM protein ArsS [Verrucomicrobia bacterium]|nr:arsenosugar biosynthesis radical SAM protein ArsS [Verrucomicrobiota bacterium]MBV8486402.1 arsenosugar biosynthesis radical SAM protein ArsS [Verrucomicrobiota bacterium]
MKGGRSPTSSRIGARSQNPGVRRFAATLGSDPPDSWILAPGSFFCVLCPLLRLFSLVPSVDTAAIDPVAGLSFSRALATHSLELRRARTEILQLNVGKLCDLTCVHCHVNAGPKRKEVITRQTVDRILNWLTETNIPTVDITGGAPEMAPDFRYLVEELRSIRQVETVIDRCNLTILLEPGYEWLAEFLAAQRVKIVASLPCYQPTNVNAQRGDGVFDCSIRALQRLNRLGYARQPDLTLDLVYNPNGDFLPPDQTELEADYKRELKQNLGIDFNRLYTIANMPIGRFAAWLRHNGRLDAYMDLLMKSFNPASISGLMCRNTLSVGWRGEVYDCDFNQQLGMQWRKQKPLFVWDLDPGQLEGQSILMGNHCFGCTAGAGSSCGGALVAAGG